MKCNQKAKRGIRRNLCSSTGFGLSETHVRDKSGQGGRNLEGRRREGSLYRGVPASRLYAGARNKTLCTCESEQNVRFLFARVQVAREPQARQKERRTGRTSYCKANDDMQNWNHENKE